MSASARVAGVGPVIGLLVLAAAVPLVQRKVDARLGGYRSQEDVLYMWSGRQMKRAAPGFEGLLADVYWLRTVQYFGAKHAFTHDRNFALLEPLMDITVTLDPRLEIAYQYGSVFLAEAPPIGAGRPQAAIDLLERGVRANPANWRLRKDLGYYYFLFMNDPQTASRVLMEAADLPGAAYWLRTMAGDFLAQGGDLRKSRTIWKQIYDDSPPGAIKHNALIHLGLLDAVEARDAVRAVVAEFAQHRGRNPTSLAELVAVGALGKVPADPAGFAFVYDAAEGHVSIDPASPMWRAKQ